MPASGHRSAATLGRLTFRLTMVLILSTLWSGDSPAQAASVLCLLFAAPAAPREEHYAAAHEVLLKLLADEEAKDAITKNRGQACTHEPLPESVQALGPGS